MKRVHGGMATTAINDQASELRSAFPSLTVERLDISTDDIVPRLDPTT